jgi:hypothetical protein
MSAIGSVSIYELLNYDMGFAIIVLPPLPRKGRLPTGFSDTRQLAFQRHPAKTDAANSKLTQKSARSAADRATIVSTRTEFGLTPGFDFQ